MHKDTSIQEFKGTKAEQRTVEAVYTSMNKEVCSVIEYDKTITVDGAERINAQLLTAIERVRRNSPKIVTMEIVSPTGTEKTGRVDEVIEGFKLNHQTYCMISFRVTLIEQRCNLPSITQETIRLTYQNKDNRWVVDASLGLKFIYDLESASDPSSNYFLIHPAGDISLITADTGYFSLIQLKLSHFQYVKAPW